MVGSGLRTLDGQLTHLLSIMPAHAVLTNWQEAGPSNTLKFPSYVDATRTRGLHNHMQHLTGKRPAAAAGRPTSGDVGRSAFTP